MATTTLEREILKRNTDCVYFLASPLTCKKGSECEYRHSDIARLNPRDCWYWFSGNCLNPTCAYRHPPLEGLTETSSLVHATHPSVITTSKTNVPCYFYFNAYCMKGEQCPFSHVMDDASYAQKFLKIAPEATSSQLVVNKSCTGSDSVPEAVEAPANHTEGTSNTKELVSETLGKNVVGDAALHNNSNEPSPSHGSPGSSNPDYEEPIVKSPHKPSPEDKYMNEREDLFSDHGSEELVKDHTEAEEWWESSPGFDVLVDDVSDHLAYEDDADYLQVRERESERLHNHLVHYDYEDSAAYDPMDYPDGRFMYDQCLYDEYEHFSKDSAPDYAGRVPESSGDSRLDSMLHRKRRSSHTGWDTEWHGVDLRDHLRKRRRKDVHLFSRNSRKCRPSYRKPTSQEHPQRHDMHLPNWDRLSSELGMELGGNRFISSHSKVESTLAESHRRGSRLGYPYFGKQTVHSRNYESLASLDDNHRRIGRLGYRDCGRPLVHSRRRENRGRRQRRERQPSLPNVLEIKEARPRQVPVISFSGPKTLTQIKQEKRKAYTDTYVSENLLSQQHTRVMSSEFEGPKSLSELLKDKRKFTSVSNSGNETATDCKTAGQSERGVINGYPVEETGMHLHGTADRLGGGYKSEWLHDAEDDDEDDLARKVAGILD